MRTRALLISGLLLWGARVAAWGVPVAGYPAAVPASQGMVHIGGSNTDIVIQSGKVYVPSGPQVTRYRLSEDFSVVEEANSPILDGVVRSLSVKDDVIIAATGVGVCVLRSALAAIELSLCVDTSGDALDVTLVGEYVVVASGASGIGVYKWGGTGLAYVNGISVGSSVTAVVADSQHVYAMVASGFVIVDWTRQESYSVVGRFSIDDIPVEMTAIALRDETVLLGVQEQLIAVSVRQPTRPEIESMVTLAVRRGAPISDIDIQGDLVVVSTLATGGEDGGVWLVDWADTLTLRKYAVAEGFVASVAASAVGDQLLVLALVDGIGIGPFLSSSTDVRKLPAIPLAGKPKAIDVSGSDVVLAGAGGMIVRDAAQLTQRFRYGYNTDAAAAVELGLAGSGYLVSSIEGDVIQSELVSIDATGSRKGLFRSPGRFYDLTQGDAGAIFAAVQETSDRRGVTVLSMDDQGAITLKSNHVVSRQGTRRVRRSGDLVAVAALDGGVGLMPADGSTPPVMKAVPEGTVMDAAVCNGQLLVGTSMSGKGRITTFDVSNITSWIQKGSVDLEASVRAIDCAGDYIVVGMQSAASPGTRYDDAGVVALVNVDGLTVLPQRVAFPGTLSELRVASQRVVVAASEGGLYAFDLSRLTGHTETPTPIPQITVPPSPTVTAPATTPTPQLQVFLPFGLPGR